MTMKTELQKFLATIIPNIAIRTIWEHDPDSGPISKECDASEDDDCQAWRSEVRATCIKNGEEIHGSAYLCGTFEKYGDAPEESNPTISGYEPQMTAEALEELKRQIEDACTVNAIAAAIAAIESRAQPHNYENRHYLSRLVYVPDCLCHLSHLEQLEDSARR